MIDSCSLCRLCYEVCPTDLDMAEVAHAARREMVQAGQDAGLGLRLRRAGPAARRRRAVRAGAARPGRRRERRRVLPRLPARGVGSRPGRARLRVSEGALLAGDRAAAVLLRGAGRLGRAGRPLRRDAGRPARAPREPRLAARDPRLPHLRDRLRRAAARSSRRSRCGRSCARWGCPTAQPARAAGAAWPSTTRARPATRPDVQLAIRDLVDACGYEVDELEMSRERTECCGFGGLMLYANPEMGDLVADRRVREGDADFVAYCSMCRDRFAARGKRTVHVLDLALRRGLRRARPAARAGAHAAVGAARAAQGAPAGRASGARAPRRAPPGATSSSSRPRWRTSSKSGTSARRRSTRSSPTAEATGRRFVEPSHRASARIAHASEP